MMKAKVVLEIEIEQNIKDKYPNFVFNYESKKHFLLEYINSLNHNISLEEQKVLKEIREEEGEYELPNDGYKANVEAFTLYPDLETIFEENLK